MRAEEARQRAREQRLIKAKALRNSLYYKILEMINEAVDEGCVCISERLPLTSPDLDNALYAIAADGYEVEIGDNSGDNTIRVNITWGR